MEGEGSRRTPSFSTPEGLAILVGDIHPGPQPGVGMEDLRFVRGPGFVAWEVGPVSVGLGLAAHLLSGGGSPPVPVLVALMALLSMCASLAARVRIPSWLLLVLCGLAQQMLHLAFDRFAGTFSGTVPAGHPARSGRVAARAVDCGAFGRERARARPGVDAGYSCSRCPADRAPGCQDGHVRFEGVDPPTPCGLGGPAGGSPEPTLARARAGLVQPGGTKVDVPDNQTCPGRLLPGR